MPFDLFFIWIVLWGIIPFYFFKGKYISIIFLVLLFVDIAWMPQLEKIGILTLHKNWILGEILLLSTVFLPSYLWAKFYYHKTNTKIRALFQVLIIFMLVAIIIPHITKSFIASEFCEFNNSTLLIQFAFIILLPALTATKDLVALGNGTPSPFDETTFLVQNGVYAYCRNPIQWSLTFIFIPLSIYYNTTVLLFGVIVSIFYTIGVSNPQENEDLFKRFGNSWVNYKKNVPSWRFLWKPKHIPKGTIYIKKNCINCEQIKSWFSKREAQNLNLVYSKEFSNYQLLQITYVNHNGKTFSSIKALSYALEHINLAWATLAWVMRFPVISHLLQLIVDAMGLKDEESDVCSIQKKD